METNYHGIKLLGSLDYKKDCSDIWGYKSELPLLIQVQIH
jgi:hypothetical protein